jgi:hypothetical protein
MTALLGGSVLLIAVSSAALVYGWLNGDDTLIWTSIGATAGAFILVVIAYIRSSREPAIVTTDSRPGPASEKPPPPPPADEAENQAQPAATEDQPTQAQPAAAESSEAGSEAADDRPAETEPDATADQKPEDDAEKPEDDEKPPPST